jgi:hypothetical protein
LLEPSYNLIVHLCVGRRDNSKIDNRLNYWWLIIVLW